MTTAPHTRASGEDEPERPGGIRGPGAFDEGDELDGDMILDGGSHTARGAREAPVAVPAHVPPDALDDAAVATRHSRRRATWLSLRQGLRRGLRRARGSSAALLVTSLTCGLAFWLSREWLAQPFPVVAPVLVWVALGIQRDRPPRRVAELGLGATIGVVFGEIVTGLLGHGLWQFVLILFIAGLLGRVLDSGELFTSQLVIQAMFMATMPTSMIQGGPVGRWSEALVGCGLAILASAFLRRDVGRRARFLGASALADLGGVLDQTAAAWRTGAPRPAADALATGRSSQGLLEEWDSAATTALDIIRVNPALRARRAWAEAEVQAATMTDRAMRNARVVARLSVGAVDEDGANPVVAEHVQRLAAAARMLAHDHRTGRDPAAARDVLEVLSGDLSPTRHKLPWRTQMVESLLRSLAVDLMQVAGASNREAVQHLAR